MKICVKGRFENQYEDWENIPVLFSFSTEGISDENGNRFVEVVTQFSIVGFIEYYVGLLKNRPVEIRWNFQNSNQGHYRFIS